MNTREEERLLLGRVLEIYDQKWIGSYLNGVSPDRWCRETINRWAKGKASPTLSRTERQALEALLPSPPSKPGEFDFIDLFAGIGGLRRAFEAVGGRCILTSEWNKQAVRTYRANYHCNPQHHRFNSDIRDLTLSNRPEIGDKEAYRHIDLAVPKHDVLLAGFPCQPFSIAGVSKKNSLGRAHGFECKTQGTLFFDVARILAVKRPAAFVLENVKNLKTHDGGRTFKVVVETLSELGYWVSDMIYPAGKDPKVVDAQHFVPQHRERVVLVGFRKDIGVHEGFTLRDIRKHFPKSKPKLGDILESDVDPKYVLTERLWEYLFNYSIEHKKRGNGFGFGLVSAESVTRTLSARYYKDGSEILVDRGFNPKRPIGSPRNVKNRPRRLTPRECARLMGFDKPNGSTFRIPVSDTQAYKQFGNSVVVPVFSAIAKIMKPRIVEAKARETSRSKSAMRRKRA